MSTRQDTWGLSTEGVSKERELTVGNPASSRRKLTALALLVTALALFVTVMADRAQADAPIEAFSHAPSTTQAGGHPNVVTQYEVGTHHSQPDHGVEPPYCLCNSPEQVTVEAPAGVIANPHSTPRCTLADFVQNQCPVDSQMGVAAIRLGTHPVVDGNSYYVSAIYNMVPKPSQAGLVAFPAPLLSPPRPIFVEFTARTESDYGLETKTIGLPRLLPVSQFTSIFWGVPADSSHDPLRFPFEGVGGFSGLASVLTCFANNPIADLLDDEFPDACAETSSFEPRPSNSPPVPLISNPTTCGAPLSASIHIDAYDLTSDSAEVPYPATTGCALLSFDPSQSTQPTTTQADAPSGLDFDLRVPQFQSPTTPSPSEIRSTTIEFPPGFTINPNAADGKAACTAASAKFGTREQGECPEFSKVGTLSIDSSALPGLIHGYVYLGESLSGNRYRVFLLADGFGLHVKLSGSVFPDPQTGQLTVSFPDLPQAPFQRFRLHVFGGERGVFSTPTRCGTLPVKSTFVPWASELGSRTSTQFFRIDSGPGGAPCPGESRPFDPGFEAGVTDNTAGAHSPFVVDLSRKDGDQFLTSLNVSTPPGFTAILAGVPYCPESAIAMVQNPLYSGASELSSSACPLASQVGTAVGGAGAGTRPLYQGGKVYLAGPYKGAPLSLLVVLPAVTGPYDVGNIAVRVAVFVDPVTARVTTISDTLPQIIDGVPLRIRRVRVAIDRAGFGLNPTRCDPFATDAQIFGDEGATVTRSSNFQVANCADLDFDPRLAIRLTGGTNRRGHPAIHAVFRANPGDANTRRVSVTLPKGELLDNSHIQTVCTRVAFANSTCPVGSKIGRAEAVTPLLAEPLKGSVYLRSSRHQLPDMVLDLEGQVDFEAAAKVDSVNGRLRTTFESVPDVPVTKIVLDLAGGRKGLLQNSESLCPASKRATAQVTGQNGASVTRAVTLQVACGKARGGRRSHRRASPGAAALNSTREAR